jgi:hypothetical protein
MKGVYIRWADESDHTLHPFAIPANTGDPAPRRITEKLFRAALRGTFYQGASLAIEPFRKTSAWWQRVTQMDPSLPDDPEGLERVAKWTQLFKWFRGHSELLAPVYIGVEEPKGIDFASVYPKWFVALTASGSLVGLVTCVVWT